MGKRRDRTDFLICAVLVAATLAVYWQVRGFGFLILDDAAYVQLNRHVTGGVTLSSVTWAFTSNYQSNWHPLTWISLMLDAQLGKGGPSLFHMTNVALHVLNTLLLFVLLKRVTGSRWRSAAVAALFALHPLHVESVAWITERKDVLSTLFWLLTMLAYVHYAKKPMARRYMLVVAAFALGLMAKPMLVSLPLVLLLMDFWPLGRVDGAQRWWPLVREKIPLIVMSAGSCLVTYWAQAVGGSVGNSEVFPLGVRVANAGVAYVSYIIKMVCPLNLCAIYPHPENTLPMWQVLGAGVCFALLMVIAVSAARRRPYVTVGLLWYTVTLVPVIGLVQVGRQAMADRYTYVPLIGLFMVLAWGVPELIAKSSGPSANRKPSAIWAALGLVLLVGLAACTYFQVGYWRDSIGLYDHALAVDNGSYLAHLGRADALATKRYYDAAMPEYQAVLKLKPKCATAHVNYGLALAQMGRWPEAVEQYKAARVSMPTNQVVLDSLGLALMRLGRVDEAIDCYRKSIESNPEDVFAYYNLGCAYARNGDFHAAAGQFKEALRLDPSNETARDRLSKAMRAARLELPRPD